MTNENQRRSHKNSCLNTFSSKLGHAAQRFFIRAANAIKRSHQTPLLGDSNLKHIAP